MQKKNLPFKSGMGYYTIQYIGEEQKPTTQELFDSVFSKLEKMQKQVMLEKIKRAEVQLAVLEDELNLFIKSKPIRFEIL